MIIEFRCDREHARLWMCREVAARQRSRIFPFKSAWTTTPATRRAGLDTLFELERMVLRKGKDGGADQAEARARSERTPQAAPDVVVDFTSAPRDPNCSAETVSPSTLQRAWREKAPRSAAILAGDSAGDRDRQ